jgi:hypothetical protein
MNEQELRADFKAQLLAQVAKTTPLVRRTERRRAVALVGAAVGAALVIFAREAGSFPAGRPPALVVGASAGIAVLAVAGLWLALDRGGSMLGRPSLRLLVVPWTAPVLFLVWRTVMSRGDPRVPAASTRTASHCLALALMTGALPLVALLVSRRGTDPTHPGASGSSIGGAVGLVVALLIDLSCPFGDASHVAVGHVAPIVLLSLAGAAIGKTILGVRPTDRVPRG